MNRERAAQVAEKEAMRYETMVTVWSANVGLLFSGFAYCEFTSYQRQEAAVAHKMKDEHERAEMEKETQEQKKYEEVVRYQQELERQLEEKECKREEAYEEFLKEKFMVDEIVRKIYEEDQRYVCSLFFYIPECNIFYFVFRNCWRIATTSSALDELVRWLQDGLKMTNLIYRELHLRLEKVVATQRYIEDFKKQQAEWRRLEREKVEVENRRIIEFAHYQQRKEEDRMAKVREREQAKETLHKMVHDSSPSAPLSTGKLSRFKYWSVLSFLLV